MTQAALFSCTGSDFRDYRGSEKIRSGFNEAKRAAPSIIFIDEIDGLLRRDADVFTKLLVELSGVENTRKPGTFTYTKKDLVVVVGATNSKKVIDEAMARPGRFDQVIYLNYPSLQERQQLLTLHAQHLPFDSKVDWQTAAELCLGCTGAQIREIVNDAAKQTFVARQTVITNKVLLEAIQQSMSSYSLNTCRTIPTNVELQFMNVVWHSFGKT
jgi:cell division protease FtsH